MESQYGLVGGRHNLTKGAEELITRIKAKLGDEVGEVANQVALSLVMQHYTSLRDLQQALVKKYEGTEIATQISEVADKLQKELEAQAIMEMKQEFKTDMI